MKDPSKKNFTIKKGIITLLLLLCIVAMLANSGGFLVIFLLLLLIFLVPNSKVSRNSSQSSTSSNSGFFSTLFNSGGKKKTFIEEIEENTHPDMIGKKGQELNLYIIYIRELKDIFEIYHKKPEEFKNKLSVFLMNIAENENIAKLFLNLSGEYKNISTVFRSINHINFEEYYFKNDTNRMVIINLLNSLIKDIEPRFEDVQIETIINFHIKKDVHTFFKKNKKIIFFDNNKKIILKTVLGLNGVVENLSKNIIRNTNFIIFPPYISKVLEDSDYIELNIEESEIDILKTEKPVREKVFYQVNENLYYIEKEGKRTYRN